MRVPLAPAWLTRAAGRLERRHWVALAASAVLHLAVLLAWLQSEPPEPEPVSFDVTMVTPPAEPKHPPTIHARRAKPKKALARHRTRKREPYTLEAEWKAERKAGKNAPAVSLPKAETLGLSLPGPSGVLGMESIRVGTPQAVHVPLVRSGQPATAAPASLAVAGSGHAAVPLGTAGTRTVAAGPVRVHPEAAGAQVSGVPGGASSAGTQKEAALESAGHTARILAGPPGQGAQASVETESYAAPGGEAGGIRLASSEAFAERPQAPSAAGSQAAVAAGTLASPSAASEAGAPTVAARTPEAPNPIQRSESPVAGGQAQAPAEGSAGNRVAGLPGTEGGLASAESEMPVGVPLVMSRTLGGMSQAPAAGVAASVRPPPPSAGPTGSAMAVAVAATAPAGGGRSPGGLGQTPREGMTSVRSRLPSPGRGSPLSVAPSGSRPVATRGRTDVAAGVERTPNGSTVRSPAGRQRRGVLTGAVVRNAALAGGGTPAAAGVAGAAPGAALAAEPGSRPDLAVAMQPVVVRAPDLLAGIAAYRSDRSAGREASGPPAAAMGASGSARVGDTPRFGAAQTTGPETRPATAYPPGVRQAGVETPPADRAGTGIATGTRPEGRRNSPGRLLTAKAEPGPLVEPDRKAKTVDADTLAPACPISYALHNPGFTFPRRAMYLGLSGKVVVRVEVLPDGRTGRMWIKHSSGSALLDEDAKSQLSRWHFVPMSRNGRHVTAWVDVPVDYRLKEGSGY